MEYTKEIIYNKILDSANNKISGKRVYNADIFTNSDNGLPLEIENIVNQIFNLRLEEIPGVTDIVLNNFRKEIGLISREEQERHISERQYGMFVNNMATESIRKATLNFYEKEYLENGIIPMHLDIKEFNISKNTINKVISNNPELKEPVTLFDIIDLEKEQVNKWYKCGDTTIREVFDIVDIYKNNDRSISTDIKEKLLSYRDLLTDLKNLQEEYNNIQNSKRTLDYKEKEVVKEMKLIKKEINNSQDILKK